MRERVSRLKLSDGPVCQKCEIQLLTERERETDRLQRESVEGEGVWTVMTEALTAGKHLTINL